jgi:hypothetical protein
VIVKTAYQAIEAHKLLRGAGCLDGIAILGRRPFRSFAPPTVEFFSRDDIIGIDLEWGGPSHYWLEFRGVYSFRQPSDDARRFWGMQVGAQQRCVGAGKPGGVSSNEILAAVHAMYCKYGYDADGIASSTALSIVMDCLEPPYVPGKEVIFQEGMVVSLRLQGRFATRAKRGHSAASASRTTSSSPRRAANGLPIRSMSGSSSSLRPSIRANHFAWQ